MKNHFFIYLLAAIIIVFTFSPLVFNRQIVCAFDNSKALQEAETYLRYSAFSRGGLIKQLIYENYSQSEAEYAADNCGADWKQQAIKAASDYLKYSAFSRDELIKQLIYDDFSQSEAEYGVDHCDVDWNEQAVKSANNTLQYISLSDSEIISWLINDGFTQDEAAYALSTIKGETPITGTVSGTNNDTKPEIYVNSEESRAIEKAKSYIRYDYSRQKTIEKLISNGFSKETAEYAADNSGADWNQHAINKTYYYQKFDYSSTKIYKKLLEDGFTKENAKYAIDNCNIDWNQQAVNKTLSYLKYDYSAQKIYKKLLEDGFTNEEAQYGIKNSGTDWVFVAYNKALSYVKYNYSNEKILNKLKSDGFTDEQSAGAVYCLNDPVCDGMDINLAAALAYIATATPTNTSTATYTLTPTETSTATATYTPTATFTSTPTATYTLTPTNTPTATYTMTSTETPTAIVTNTPIVTYTATPTATYTLTPTETPTATATYTPTATSTVTSTETATATATQIPTTTITVIPTKMPIEISDVENKNSEYYLEILKSYSYDQLLEIQTELNQKITRKRQQWAENYGNRIIDLDIKEMTLYTTKTQNIIPTVTRVIDEAPVSTSFIWSSSDENVARVSVNGAVTGVGKGDAKITCTAKDDARISATAIVHVILPVTGLTISENQVKLLLTDNPETSLKSLSVSIAPEEAFCKDVIWSSNNEKVAIVDSQGNVQAIAPGTAVITVSSVDEYSISYPKKAVCTVTVQQGVLDIKTSSTKVILNKGAYTNITALISPDNATLKTLKWDSSNPEVVRVVNGQITGVSYGDAVVTCSTTDGSEISSKINVSVIQMVNSIRINNSSSPVILKMGENLSLSTDVLPEEATNKALIWTSSDENVITVNNAGIVTAVSKGNATITCTAVDGSEKSASISISVPSISYEMDEIVVKSKNGLIVDMHYTGEPDSLVIDPVSTDYFSLVTFWNEKNNDFSLAILPKSAGNAVVKFKDNEAPSIETSLRITIDHSAVYDEISYPRADYFLALYNPEKYINKNISIEGIILEIIETENNLYYRVNTLFPFTSGYEAFLVDCSDVYFGSDIPIEGSWVELFGVGTGTFSYKAVNGKTATIPSMKAEDRGVIYLYPYRYGELDWDLIYDR